MWEDKGLIFEVNDLLPWARSHCYVPTALLKEDRIRVYAAFWDERMHGRLGYVDVDIREPTRVLGYATAPIVDDSQSGCFDCDGVTPLSVINDGEKIRLYYAGWQRFDQPGKRYTLFTGMLVSDMEGDMFTRWSSSPIIGPRSDGEHLRTGGYTGYVNGKWQTWYANHEKTIFIKDKAVPTYSLNTIISPDGIDWSGESTLVLPTQENIVLGYGRSAIWYEASIGYQGLFSERDWSGGYPRIRYGKSHNGVEWEFDSESNKNFTITDTLDGQTSVCFPSLVHQENSILMFYNGDDFGRDGLRLAIWNNE